MFCNLQNSQCKSSVAAVRKKMAPKRICLIGAGPSGMSVLYQLERLRKEGVAGPLEVSGFWCVKFQPFIHFKSNRVQLLLYWNEKMLLPFDEFFDMRAWSLLWLLLNLKTHTKNSSNHNKYFKKNLTGNIFLWKVGFFLFSYFFLLKSY